jgi:hypothetical protein
MKLENLERLRTAAAEARENLKTASKLIKDPNANAFAVVRLDDLTAVLDRLDAEELVAETYSKVYDAEAKRADENFKAWRASEARNLRLDGIARAAIGKYLETAGLSVSATSIDLALKEFRRGLE